MRGRKRMRVVATIVAIAMLLTVVGGTAVSVLTAASASAHDQLLSSDPEDGAELDEPVEEVSLTFSADVIAEGTQVLVTTPSGDVEADVTVEGAVVTAGFGEQTVGGDYAVTWRVVSSDGHPITGEFAYTVAGQAGDEASAEASASPAEEPVPAASAESVLEESGEADGLGATEPTPSSTTDAEETAGAGSMPLLYGAALIAAIGVAVALLMRSRRRLHESVGQDPRDRDQD
ncbi:copper resistance protein CopC [Isoptericola chiayiensis]|uniref:Copper resistance protein CopC n=1 Tax=Isoptericola chiayiensis TaxID=579446 RepID=A0ABP8XY69_9MICO